MSTPEARVPFSECVTEDEEQTDDPCPFDPSMFDNDNESEMLSNFVSDTPSQSASTCSSWTNNVSSAKISDFPDRIPSNIFLAVSTASLGIVSHNGNGVTRSQNQLTRARQIESCIAELQVSGILQATSRETDSLMRQALKEVNLALKKQKWDNKDDDEKDDVDICLRKWDVLSGRGGKSNHHPGNKRFRQVVEEMKSKYRVTSEKTVKTALSKALVAYVVSYGGRFLTIVGPGKYRKMTRLECRRKTSQALRETKELKWKL